MRSPDSESPPAPLENPWAFPLSFLIFLTVEVSLFFALWRLSPWLSVFSALLLTPGLMRTMWVTERRRMTGTPLSFAQQGRMWGTSLLVTLAALVGFASVFVAIFVAMMLGGALLGRVMLGIDGFHEGLVLGSVLGLPLASVAAAFLSAAVLRQAWSEEAGTRIDMRN